MRKCTTLLATMLLAVSALTSMATAQGASKHVGWSTIKRLGVEHRAQACGDRALGGEQRLIELRGNSRQARIRSGYRWEIFVDGKLYRSVDGAGSCTTRRGG